MVVSISKHLSFNFGFAYMYGNIWTLRAFCLSKANDLPDIEIVRTKKNVLSFVFLFVCFVPNTLFLHHVACHTKITSNKDNINELIAALQYLFFCSESVGFQFFLMHNVNQGGFGC